MSTTFSVLLCRNKSLEKANSFESNAEAWDIEVAQLRDFKTVVQLLRHHAVVMDYAQGFLKPYSL